MIVLDTNVISELMRGAAAEPRVIRWLRSLDRQPVTTVINRAEVLSGIAILPAGQRRERLRAHADRAFAQLGMVLPVTDGCASQYADIVATRRALGKPVSVMDALIAAIVKESNCALATRNAGDFEGLGIELVDPW